MLGQSHQQALQLHPKQCTEVCSYQFWIADAFSRRHSCPPTLGLVESSPSTSKERPRKRITTPVESVSKPKLPVELAVDDILDPSRDKVKETRREEDVCVFVSCDQLKWKYFIFFLLRFRFFYCFSLM